MSDCIYCQEQTAVGCPMCTPIGSVIREEPLLVQEIQAINNAKMIEALNFKIDSIVAKLDQLQQALEQKESDDG